MVTRGRPEKRIPALAKAIGAIVGARVGGLLAVRPPSRRRGARRARRRAARGIGIALSGVAGTGDQGRRHPYKVFTPFLRRVAQTRLAGAGGVRPEIRTLDRPARMCPAGWTSPTSGSSWSCPQASARRAVSGSRSSQKRTRRLRRGPQPAGPARHQPDVGAPEVRHHPSAHHGGRPRQGHGRPGLSARTGVPRLLRRGASRVARQCVVELEHVLRRDSGRRATRTLERCSRRGRPAGPDFRSSTPACANWPRPASCTTGCG